ncbi:hypothetical protein [Candidatus Thiodictyon syntrophicum]|jgi:hypothetical protein|uniref:DUF306 domain-containing protein n=1 Tax=Candidatus Thiodictyon syntrophicum TaxID=1166950 RepID=A0A2K8UAD0_9GAMM|nr:hypothetical protein [Candidatus Thiodictyon syntrophicum]AUB82540.1 hypothetical protein THSYN_17375 [Candidatus Thiodictyon syntrophicum]
MNTHCVAARHVLWLSVLLVVAGASPADAEDSDRVEDDTVAFYQGKGFVLVSTTEVEVAEGYDFILFEGCETGKEIPLANGQTFVCEDDGAISAEFMADVSILKHPTTGETKVVIANRTFKGTLKGIADPASLVAALPVAAPPAPQPSPPVAEPRPVAPPPAPAPGPQPPAFGDLRPVPSPAPPPGPRPLPPTFATPAPAPGVGPPSPQPPSATLIAPVVGTWHTSLVLGGARVEGIAILEANGNFNRFERWDFGLTVQVWGTYTVSPISSTLFQLSQKPTGWEPQEWCVRDNVCTQLNYPAAATQFTFLDADRLRDEQTKAVYKRQ